MSVARFLSPFIGVILCLSSFAQAAEPYQGRLYDAHAHLSKRDNVYKALMRHKEAGFDKIAFFAKLKFLPIIQKKGQGAIYAFADPFERKKPNFSKGRSSATYRYKSDRLDEIIGYHDAGALVGFGEIYYHLGYAPFATSGIRTDLDNTGSLAMLKVAAEKNMPVQMHLDASHRDKLEALLSQNPQVTFVLAHCGFYDPAELQALMDQYPNLYAETSLIMNPFTNRFAKLPLGVGGLKEDWEALLMRHADRIMIGSDYTQGRADELPKLATYYRSVLGHLPKEKADMIAHGNFEKLFVKNKP